MPTKTPETTVIAVRVSSSFMDEVARFAAAHDMTVSQVLRAGAERMIRPSTVIFQTGTPLQGSVTVYGSPSAGGRSDTQTPTTSTPVSGATFSESRG